MAALVKWLTRWFVAPVCMSSILIRRPILEYKIDLQESIFLFCKRIILNIIQYIKDIMEVLYLMYCNKNNEYNNPYMKIYSFIGPTGATGPTGPQVQQAQQEVYNLIHMIYMWSHPQPLVEMEQSLLLFKL